MKAALVGDGIGQSLTPMMHEAEGAAQGLGYSYERFDTSLAPWHGMALHNILDHAERAGFAGLNITHPHKTHVAALLDALEGPAADLGTVNTVVFAAGKRTGHTTDYHGFEQGIRRAGLDLAGKRIVQFGAGGGGSATALALLDAGATLAIVDLDAARAEALAQRLHRARPTHEVRAPERGSVDLGSAAGAVNATPLGMKAYPGMAFDPALLPDSAWVADIVYFPLETALLAAARARGLRILSGADMAIFQAVAAFELITGSKADPERMARQFARATGAIPSVV